MLCESNNVGIHAFFPAIISNGGYIIKESNGVYTSGLCEPNAIEAMEFMTGLHNDGLIKLCTGGSWTPLEEKTWLFLNDSGLSVSNEDVLSIVRFPYGPSGNKDIIAAYSIKRYYYAFSILTQFDNDEIGIIVDDLFEPLDVSIYPEGWKDYAIENLFYNDSDQETFMTGLNTMCYYPMVALYGEGLWTYKGEVENTMNNIFSGQITAQSGMESVKGYLNELIDSKLNNK